MSTWRQVGTWPEGGTFNLEERSMNPNTGQSAGIHPDAPDHQDIGGPPPTVTVLEDLSNVTDEERAMAQSAHIAPRAAISFAGRQEGAFPNRILNLRLVHRAAVIAMTSSTLPNERVRTVCSHKSVI